MAAGTDCAVADIAETARTARKRKRMKGTPELALLSNSLFSPYQVAGFLFDLLRRRPAPDNLPFKMR
jgi:hypothetical protein